MTAIWNTVLATYWMRIEQETRNSLVKAKEHFESKDLQFNGDFIDYFMRRTHARISSVFNDFKMELEFEQQLNVIIASSNGRKEHEPSQVMGQLPTNASIIGMDDDVGRINRPDEEQEIISTNFENRLVAPDDLNQATIISISSEAEPNIANMFMVTDSHAEPNNLVNNGSVGIIVSELDKHNGLKNYTNVDSSEGSTGKGPVCINETAGAQVVVTNDIDNDGNDNWSIQPRKGKNADELDLSDILNKKRNIDLGATSIPQSIQENEHRNDFSSKEFDIIGQLNNGNGDDKPTQEECKVAELGAEEQSLKKADGSSTGRKKSIQSKDLNVNASRKYKCMFCGYESIFKSHLTYHSRTHTGERPYKCKICKKRFVKSHHLKDHMRTHASEFAFHCSICRKGFNSEEVKRSHEKTCDPRRFACYLCKYHTFIKSNLINHMRTHTGERPFRCLRCFKSFIKKVNLTKHMKVCNNKNKN